MAAGTEPVDWPDAFPGNGTFGPLWALSKQEEIVGNPNDAQPVGKLQEMIEKREEVTGKEATTLRQILCHIRSLCDFGGGAKPGWGDKYNKIEPSQYIYRRKIKNSVEVVSKGQGVWPFSGLALQGPNRPITPATKNYWTLTDLLGLFFSNLGPAPGGARRSDFYVPLLALFTRWVYILITPNPEFNIDRPNTTAIMWVQPQPGDTETPRNIYIGSNPGGIVGGLRKNNGRARFDLLTKTDVPELHKKGVPVPGQGLLPWSFDTHIEIFRFGNCAETYSYLQLLLSLQKQREAEAAQENPRGATIHGFAMRFNSEKLKVIKANDVYDENVMFTAGGPKKRAKDSPEDYLNLMNPCENCRHVIRTLEGGRILDNFLTQKGLDFPDPKPSPRRQQQR